MGKKRTSTDLIPAGITDDAYKAVLADISGLLESARRAAARSVNAVMTATYWAVGRRIVEEEQRGQRRADYGEQLITRLAEDLTRRFGRGFGYRSLYQMRRFYMTCPGILQTASAKSGRPTPVEASSTADVLLKVPIQGPNDAARSPGEARGRANGPGYLGRLSPRRHREWGSPGPRPFFSA